MTLICITMAEFTDAAVDDIYDTVSDDVIFDAANKMLLLVPQQTT